MNSYLGIDVSKGYADFVLIDESFEELERTFQLDDTAKGHAALRKQLKHFIEAHSLSVIYCGLESTGGFEDNWFGLLCELADTLPVQSARLNPSVVKKAAEASKNHQITDALSAKNIASYLVRFGDKVDYQARDNHYREFRSLQNHISMLSKQKTQLINELKALMYTCFPELQHYCKQGVPNWVLALLQAYPTSSKLGRASEQKVARLKGITSERAKKLIEKAKEGISKRGLATDELLIKIIADDIKGKRTLIRVLKDRLAKECKGKEIDQLITIIGIADYSAASIMVEIEDISRFSTAGQLVSYFGLHPSLRESGDKRSVSRMSKKGRPAIRATLYMCAGTAVVHDPHLKSI